jgi:hypothetical protein
LFLQGRHTGVYGLKAFGSITMGITAGHYHRTAGLADRYCDMGIVKAHTVGSQAVDVWRNIARPPAEAAWGVPVHIIRRYQENVWLFLLAIASNYRHAVKRGQRGPQTHCS